MNVSILFRLNWRERASINRDNPFVPGPGGDWPVNPAQSLSVTISNGTSVTYTKEFRSPFGAKPTVTVNDSSFYWTSGITRTFSITNCTDVPDTALTWEVKKTIMYSNGNPNSTSYSYYTGRTLMYRGTTPSNTFSALQITATNTHRECEPKSVVLNFLVRRIKSLSAYDGGDILDVTVLEDESGESISQTKEDKAPLTLELWHNIYGCMRTRQVESDHEQIDISGMPQGVYVLLLKEGGVVIEQTKVTIY